VRNPPPDSCPKCGVTAPCVDWNEVDIGVGVQVFEAEYECPKHGCYAYVGTDKPGSPMAPLFRDDAEPESERR
jgi:hypothetical protein